MTSSLSVEVLPWGKYDPCHRLEHHCADVAACLEALIAEPVLRDRFEKAIGERGLDQVTEARLAVIAFLHDFGKVCTGFQFQVGNRRPGTPRRASHLKAFFWACNSPDLVGGLGLNQISTWGAGLDRLLRAALAHHGRPMTGHELERPRRPDIWLPHDGYDPVAAGRHLLQCARQWFPAAFRPGPQLPTTPALAHLFAGAVAIADQIGSNEELFKREANFDESYMDRARRRATGAVQALGFARAGWASRTTRTDFGALFGDWEPRPLQSAVAQAPLDCPLLILESETGSGKTEAAIWRFAKLWRAGTVDGLYFALPTRAAAAQLHGRVNQALSRVFPAEARLKTVLAVPGYIRAGDAIGRAAGWTVTWADDPKDEERLARWSAESARKFLGATAAVGTVDQALLSGLLVKWAHFRGAALARSLLVVDEVHASDAYMTEVLKAVLRGHLEVGGHALLMSATLGATARDSLTTVGPRRRRGKRTGLAAAKAVEYPVLTLRTHQGPSYHKAFDSVGYQRDVSMTEMPILRDPNRIAQIAIREARQGAKVLVIRNTVNAVREVFDEVRGRRGEELLLDVAGGPAIHHSRFAAEDRRLLDTAVEAELGKGRPAGGRIVIGTQTLEQSLDIDADVLITDLCPVDVLLQRIGRLHRHESGMRPDGFSSPRCLVMVPGGGLKPEGHLAHGMGQSRKGGIYRDMRVLELTRRLVVSHRTWVIPQMNRLLVEEGTHPDRTTELEEELGSDWAERSLDVAGRKAAERQVAQGHVLDRSIPFEDITFPGHDERVRTRLGEDGPRIRLAEPAMGPFGQQVGSFSLPAHLFPGPGPTKAEIEEARAEAVSGGLVLAVGAHRFRYDRGGIRRGS